MNNRLENIFTNFANSHEDYLNGIGLSKESFIEQAREWSKTEEGKLEIQKFILQQEIVDLEEQISDINETISKKRESINDIDVELSKL